MTSEKRYISIVADDECIPQIPKSQIVRVLLLRVQ